MTPREFTDALDALHLSRTAAAPVLGVELRTVRRYASGERPVPQVIANFLGALQLMQGLTLT